jgi:C4-dicarboxylate-specific signal transduction histidine kinase
MRRLAANFLWGSPSADQSGRDVLQRLTPYLIALLLVGLALLATAVLQHIYVRRPSLFPFFAAIATAAWFGGRGPGFFAVAVSVPFGLYFYGVSRSDHGLHGRDVLLFVFFAVCAFVGDALYKHRRQTEETLRKAHRQLQTNAAELQRTNNALVAEMAERQRTEAALDTTRNELARAARLTSMAEMAASIAHEINQPLAAIVTNADTCVRWLNAPTPELDEAREAAKRIVRDAERAGQVVTRIRAMVKSVLVEPVQVSLRASLDEVLALLQAEIEKHRVTVHSDIDPALPAFAGDRIQMQQVFVNLITNAVESLSQTIDRPRHLWIAARRTPEEDLEVTFRDDGQGFADGVLARLFDSFVTTKADGMGMGLSICRTVVQAHGGVLVATPALPHGAQFTITIPLNGGRDD